MKHARKDYDRIQDPENIIPQDEPVFLLRGKDLAAPATIEAWCIEAKKLGAKDDIIELAKVHAEKMREWQRNVESQIPDLP